MTRSLVCSVIELEHESIASPFCSLSHHLRHDSTTSPSAACNTICNNSSYSEVHRKFKHGSPPALPALSSFTSLIIQNTLRVKLEGLNVLASLLQGMRKDRRQAQRPQYGKLPVLQGRRNSH